MQILVLEHTLHTIWHHHFHIVANKIATSYICHGKCITFIGPHLCIKTRRHKTIRGRKANISFTFREYISEKVSHWKPTR